MAVASLRDKKIDALKRMLNFNTSLPKGDTFEPVWKVLIYDNVGLDIISPLLNIKELHSLGVTLHLLIHKERESLPDVPAIYFVLPTPENISQIVRDFHTDLYDSYHLNFISPISRGRLEDLAQGALAADVVHKISKVVDQYTNFISLEDDLFILRNNNHDKILSNVVDQTLSFYAMNRPEVSDAEMDAMIVALVDALFSVFVTAGTVPIITAPRGNSAAEMVAEKLDKKLRDNLRDPRNSLFTATHEVYQGGGGGGGGAQFMFQRPLLVLLDRSMDLATPFHHTWTYQALAHDVLKLRMNRVEIEENVSSTSNSRQYHGGKMRTFDLSVNTDKFWREQKGNPFPEVAEAVQEALEEYRGQEQEIKKLKAAMGLSDGDDSNAALSAMQNNMMMDNTSKLSSAFSSLPELMERKRLLDQHTNIATSLLEHIKQRKLDQYFEIEEKLMSSASGRFDARAVTASMLELFNSNTINASDVTGVDSAQLGSGVNAGNSDMLRLFIIALLCGPNMSNADYDQYIDMLKSAGCSLDAIKYVKRHKAHSKQLNVTGADTQTKSMFSKLVTQGSAFLMEGVKNLVVKKHNLPFTRVVDALMDHKSLPEVDEYRYFDPKLHRAAGSSQQHQNEVSQRIKQMPNFAEAYVFVIGGGNYIEYQNLQDYCGASKSSGMSSSAAVLGGGGGTVVSGGVRKRIYYGCTELMNANEFLRQLTQLGAGI